VFIDVFVYNFVIVEVAGLELWKKFGSLTSDTSVHLRLWFLCFFWLIWLLRLFIIVILFSHVIKNIEITHMWCVHCSV